MRLLLLSFGPLRTSSEVTLEDDCDAGSEFLALRPRLLGECNARRPRSIPVLELTSSSSEESIVTTA